MIQTSTTKVSIAGLIWYPCFSAIYRLQALLETSARFAEWTGNRQHMGISRVPGKSNLSYMNVHRDHLLFRDLYVRLLDTLWQKQMHLRPELRMLKRKVLLMDITVIPRCLSVFDWARFRSAKGAVKLHMILDYKGCMPIFVHIMDGKTHESTIAKTLSFRQRMCGVGRSGLYRLHLNERFGKQRLLFRNKEQIQYEIYGIEVLAKR